MIALTSALGEATPTKQHSRVTRRVTPGSKTEEKLVTEYLPLVKSVVGRLAMTLPSHVDLDDLYSAGMVGLLNAVRNFNPKSGTSLETYARLRIRGAVLDELRRMDWVPRSVHGKARKVQAVMQELEQRNGKMPSELEMARALNISLPEYQQWLEEIRPATYICLDAASTLDGEDGPSHYETFAHTNQETPLDGVSKREISKLISKRLQQLPEMQRKVLALYYFEDLRLREIAQAFGLTESRICQIHAQGVLAIKSFLHRHGVRSA
jgi:RNA polymerase sigma factor for flagellar operon FliA